MSGSMSLQSFVFTFKWEEQILVTGASTAVSVGQSRARSRVDGTAKRRTDNRPRCASAGSR